jgi:RNA polymerase sigma factor (sigma-70 family)
MTKEQLKNYARYRDLVKHYDRKIEESKSRPPRQIPRRDLEARGRAARKMAAIEEAIASVPDPTAQLLLRLRYIEERSWVQVGFALHYSESQIKRIHNRALKMLEGVNLE